MFEKLKGKLEVEGLDMYEHGMHAYPDINAPAE